MFSFPNPVNEVAARTVAAGVALLCAVTIVLVLAAGPGWLWLTALLAYGFLARVVSGPTLSPLGRFATGIAAPRVGREKRVAGPPKRFAQGIGATLSVRRSSRISPSRPTSLPPFRWPWSCSPRP